MFAGTFWRVTEESTRGCKVDGLPLDCRISNDTRSVSVYKSQAGLPSWQCLVGGTLLSAAGHLAAAADNSHASFCPTAI
jgi:hypothetical protein